MGNPEQHDQSELMRAVLCTHPVQALLHERIGRLYATVVFRQRPT